MKSNHTFSVISCRLLPYSIQAVLLCASNWEYPIRRCLAVATQGTNPICVHATNTSLWTSGVPLLKGFIGSLRSPCVSSSTGIGLQMACRSLRAGLIGTACPTQSDMAEAGNGSSWEEDVEGLGVMHTSGHWRQGACHRREVHLPEHACTAS